MKKIIVIPDSFKGTMSSTEVCKIIKTELTHYFNPSDIITIPIADGGEGTVDCFMHFTDASLISIKTKGPVMNDIIASYAIFNHTAIIETASAAGYSISPDSTTPLDTTTYGVGLLMLDAIHKGCKKIILGLGGSCTNDAGCGIASALNAKFIDEYGNNFIPTGKNLGNVKFIDLSETEKLLDGIEITGMCDITNPLYGKNGAAYIFAPQKGASKDDVVLLDLQLKKLSDTICKCINIDVSKIKGGGAAGGVGAGIHAFLNGTLISGIDLILDLVDFSSLLNNCSVVITGEGKLDSQSLNGKAITGISRRAQEKNIPVIVVAGEKESKLNNLSDFGIHSVFETGKIDRTKPLHDIKIACQNALKIQSGFLGKYLNDLIKNL